MFLCLGYLARQTAGTLGEIDVPQSITWYSGCGSPIMSEGAVWAGICHSPYGAGSGFPDGRRGEGSGSPAETEQL